MSESQQGELIEGHDYDGIQELDNDLPRWWLHGFYYTIAFAVVYMLYYHYASIGPTPEQEFLTEMYAAGYRVPADATRDVLKQDLALALMGICCAIAALLVSWLVRMDREYGKQQRR